MIEKLTLPSSTYRGGSDYPTLAQGDVRALLAKLNEVIEAVNEIRTQIGPDRLAGLMGRTADGVVSNPGFITIENPGASG